MPAWNFSNFFTVKESLAFMFEMASLREDALREYDELEQIYTEIVNVPHANVLEFGGLDAGDDCAALLDGTRKSVNQFAADGAVREFDFRQYLFSRQASLLFDLQRPAEVSGRGHSFIISFAKILTQHEKELPFCMREIWVITACLTLVKATSQRFSASIVSQGTVKDFHRLQGDLYSYARTKLMRLADLIGYGHNIETSPCNSAALSMLPWPKPAVWPAVPSDFSLIQAKEEVSPPKLSEGFGRFRRQLSLSPTVLLREANRRRSSLSVGSLAEMLDLSRLSAKESPAADGAGDPLPTLTPEASNSEVHSSTPETLKNQMSIEPPMKLPEVQAAAEHALLTSISDETLRKALSSVEGFEDLFLDLTRSAADNFHRSWRKRHGLVLDGEVAAVHYRRGALDAAAKLYEKVCALYGSEGWHALLVQVLPRLSECQKKLSDWAGYLSSCIKLLSLDPGCISGEDRRSIQTEIVKLAHGGLPVPVSLDVSTLITFAARGGPPLELCEGDPGTLMVTLWSGFPEDITLDSLSLTLVTTFTADEGTRVVKSVDTPVLKPGKNVVLMTLPPQRPGSYVLGVLTGHIGHVILRSHTYCTTSAASSKGGPPDSDDYLSNEKPIRIVLEVAKPRALVEIKPAIAKGLLFGEPQWVGLIIRPLGYSLEGAHVHISAGPNLQFMANQIALLDVSKAPQAEANAQLNTDTDGAISEFQNSHDILDSSDSFNKDDHLSGKINLDADVPQQLQMKDGSLELPYWSRMVTSVLWIQVKADSDDNSISHFSGDPHLFSPPPSPKKVPSITSDSQLQDLVPAADLVSESQLNGNLGQGHVPSNGKFVSRFGMNTLKVKMEFGVSRNRLYERTISLQFTHPFRISTRIVSRGNDGRFLLQITLNSQMASAVTIKSANLVLQPGFAHVNNHEGYPTPSWLLPLSVSALSECALLFAIRSDSVTTKDGDCLLGNGSGASHQRQDSEDLYYELKANEDYWMIAGRRKGFISLSPSVGSRIVLSMACVPLVAGHVHPPALRLVNIGRAHVSRSPAGPHLVCILPPAPCSALCIRKGI
uniref:Trafficking protein particle complex subunit 11 domain-containing protein n=1 Tax=Physcomitrium patens TaxID=3218 RepID=A0A7I4FIM0_PHYPA